MTPEQAQNILDELHELSPPPLYDAKDYFDNEELKEQDNEHRTDKDDWNS